MEQKLKNIKAFVFDVDGVFSSGVVAMDNGDLLRMYDIRDGYAVRLAIKAGFIVAIITKGNSLSTRYRFVNTLKVNEYYSNVSPKIDALKEIIQKYNLSPNEVLFMGDDIPDVECMRYCAIGACPNDAMQDAIENADIITKKDGGKGAVREIIEKTMRLQNKWNFIQEDKQSDN